MNVILTNLKQALLVWLLELVFGMYSGILSMLNGALNTIFPIIVDILKINPFGSADIYIGDTATTAATINLEGMSDIIRGFSETLEFLGIELALLFGIYGMLRTSASLVETKRVEHVFQHFLKFGITVWLVSNIYEIIETIFNIFLGVNDLLLSGGSASYTFSQANYELFSYSQAIEATAVDSGWEIIINNNGIAGTIRFGLTHVGIVVFIVVLIILLIATIGSWFSIFGSAISVLKEMVARVVRFYLHLILCPLVIPFGLTEGTKNHLKNYFTSLAGVALEWVLSLELILIIGKLLTIVPDVVAEIISAILTDILTSWWGSALDTPVVILTAAVSGCALFASYALLLNILKSLMGKLDTIAKGMLALGGI